MPTYRKGDERKRQHVWDHSGTLGDSEIGQCACCGKGTITENGMIKVLSKSELKKIFDNPLFKWGG
jgi:hypothetical protein